MWGEGAYTDNPLDEEGEHDYTAPRLKTMTARSDEVHARDNPDEGRCMTTRDGNKKRARAVTPPASAQQPAAPPAPAYPAPGRTARGASRALVFSYHRPIITGSLSSTRVLPATE